MDRCCHGNHDTYSTNKKRLVRTNSCLMFPHASSMSWLARVFTNEERDHYSGPSNCNVKQEPMGPGET